jgi:hypothetical protein
MKSVTREISRAVFKVTQISILAAELELPR